MPLVIAILMVMNTIKGSVYERRDEIAVYNAAGIAPRWILSIFFAEAAVYAVVGAVLGYLLSQGAGRLLTATGIVGGLSMNFTSMASFYVSVGMIASVLVSTWYPARIALDIAAPAEESGWRLPAPIGDRISFDLPFTFRPLEQLGILAYLGRFLNDHGEGSGGRFFAGIPRAGIDADRSDQRLAVPIIRCQIWMKPYDLAVSQDLVLSFAKDPDTGESVSWASLTRQTGTRESWLRLNKSFIRLVRRHLLHWRAVGDSDRSDLCSEALDWLSRSGEGDG